MVRRGMREDGRTRVEELALPLGDLHGMHAELTGQLIQGLLALDRLQGDAGFELTTVAPSGTAAHTSVGLFLFLLGLLLL